MAEDAALKLARVYSLVAEMYAVNADIEGMRAFNTNRSSHGYSIGYDEDAFAHEADKLRGISARLAEIAGH